MEGSTCLPCVRSWRPGCMLPEPRPVCSLHAGPCSAPCSLPLQVEDRILKEGLIGAGVIGAGVLGLGLIAGALFGGRSSRS